MKFAIIIFILIILIVSISSCEVDNEVFQMVWTKKYDYLSYDERSLSGFVSYRIESKELKSVLDLKFTKLQCGIKEICTKTVPRTRNLFNASSYYYSFCELYFKFEHKRKYVFTIDHLELALFSIRNFTIDPNQLINNFGKSLFNTRLV